MLSYVSVCISHLSLVIVSQMTLLTAELPVGSFPFTIFSVLRVAI